MKDRKGKIRKSDKKEFDRREVKKGYHSSVWMEKSVQLRRKRSVVENKRHEFLGGEMGNHAVTTPTMTATNAPRALKTFLDPEFLLLLLPLVVLEGLEPPEVLLGVPEEPPRLGVEVGLG
jgi:hypothetical protein